MTRQRLLARVAPVSEPLPFGNVICNRCGKRFATDIARAGHTQCPSCRPAPRGHTYEILQLADAGWEPKDIATELGIHAKYVRLIIRSNPV